MNLTIEGNTAFLAKLKDFPKDAELLIEEEVTIAIDEIYDRAQLAAPTDTAGGGGIRSSAYKDVRGLEGEIGYNSVIAAYHEFGTGAKVDVPPGLEEYAMTFFVNGEGRLPANAFLFPAFFAVSKEFSKAVMDGITKLWER